MMPTNKQHFVHTQPHLFSPGSQVPRYKADAQEIIANLETQLSDFFDSFTSDEFSNKLSVILQAYSANDYYRESSPSDVLFIMEKLSDLVNSAYNLYLHHFSRTQSATSINGFSQPEIPADSLQQIAMFFEHQQIQEWQDTIKHITFFALCKDSPADAGYNDDTLFLFNAFNKLVSACYHLLK